MSWIRFPASMGLAPPHLPPAASSGFFMPPIDQTAAFSPHPPWQLQPSAGSINWCSPVPFPSPLPQPVHIINSGPVAVPHMPGASHGFPQALGGNYRPTSTQEDVSPSVSHTPVAAAQSQKITTPKLEDIDATALISKLRGLATQANEIALQIVAVTNIKPVSLPVKQKIIEAANVKQESRDTVSVDSLTSSSFDASNYTFAPDGGEIRRDKERVNKLFGELLKNSKDEHGVSDENFYDDAPGIVQMPALSDVSTINGLALPDFAAEERWVELTAKEEHRGNYSCSAVSICKAMLPSNYWLLQKELRTWNELPLGFSLIQLEAAMALGRIKMMDLKKWLLASGVVTNRLPVKQILVLVVFCLRAVQREAVKMSSKCASKSHHNEKLSGLQMAKSHIMVDSGHWLSSVLSPLCDVATSKKVVLGLYKHALEDAAHSLVFTDSGFENRVDIYRQQISSLDGDESKEEEASFKSGTFSLMKTRGDGSLDDTLVGEGLLSLQHVAAAIVAIHEEAMLEQSKKAEFRFFNASPFQRSAIHSICVQKAEELRAMRSDYRAVLDHDGLTWQRPQNQAFGKNKTKEELLAEERDYKRRRMSYRGKKVKRTPVQVVHDIIEGHMKDIVSCGGIGFVCKRDDVLPVPQSEIEGSSFQGGGKKCGSEHVQSIRTSDDVKSSGHDGRHTATMSNCEASQSTREDEAKSMHLGPTKQPKNRHNNECDSHSGDKVYQHSSSYRSTSSHRDSSRSHHGHNKYDSPHQGHSKYDSQQREDRDYYRRSTYHGYVDRKESFHERKYDRWETKLEEERDGHRR